MSVHPRRWFVALLLLIFAIGTTQAASALPSRCGGDMHGHGSAKVSQSHVDHADALLDDVSDDSGCGDDMQGMSAKKCAAFCLVAVPVPSLVRLDPPGPLLLPEPSLSAPGQGWLPPRDGPPPRTSSIG